MHPDQLISRAQRAERLLNDADLQAAIKAVREEILLRWRLTEPSDVDAREHFWRMHEALGNVEDLLRGWLEAGRFEDKKAKAKGLSALWK